MHSSSTIINKRWLLKLGDPHKNTMVEKLSDNAAFRVAWEECIILVKFIEQQLENQYETNGSVSVQHKPTKSAATEALPQRAITETIVSTLPSELTLSPSTSAAVAPDYESLLKPTIEIEHMKLGHNVIKIEMKLREKEDAIPHSHRVRSKSFTTQHRVRV